MTSAPVDPSGKLLVLDANILVRAVLGRRVQALLETYAPTVHFITAEVAFRDAGKHLPEILARRGLTGDEVTPFLNNSLARLPLLVAAVPDPVYADHEEEARRRVRDRDEADWPFVALALRFNCPVWSEDRDLFGAGIPVWTTDRVEIYLSQSR
jgi:predicted nucleic acid-binding protein